MTKNVVEEKQVSETYCQIKTISTAMPTSDGARVLLKGVLGTP